MQSIFFEKIVSPVPPVTQQFNYQSIWNSDYEDEGIMIAFLGFMDQYMNRGSCDLGRYCRWFYVYRSSMRQTRRLRSKLSLTRFDVPFREKPIHCRIIKRCIFIR